MASRELNIDNVMDRIAFLQHSQSHVIALARQIYDVTHWKSPLKSLVALLSSCMLCFFAEYLLSAAFLAIPAILLLGYAKSKVYALYLQEETKKQAQPRFKDEKKRFLNACNEDVAKSREKLKQFRLLVGQAHEIAQTLIYMGEEIRNLFYWKRPRWSFGYSLVGLIGWLGYVFVSWRVPLLFCVIWLFTRNGKMIEILFKKTDVASIPVDSASDLSGDSGEDRERTPKSDDDDDDTEINEDAMRKSQVRIQDSSERSDSENSSDSETESRVLSVASEPEVARKRLSGFSRFLRRRNRGDNDNNDHEGVILSGLRCFQCTSKLPQSHENCPRCGETFCSSCCCHAVKKAQFGATAPGAAEETVSVCLKCYMSFQRR
ncbi:protrudin-like [Oscarella lobularis]|uniref:protrudin-like n=1 Tax=Oscarella lobularis TaxID=121494 RepID=UPI003313364B